MQEFPDLPFRVLVMQYVHPASAAEWEGLVHETTLGPIPCFISVSCEKLGIPLERVTLLTFSGLHTPDIVLYKIIILWCVYYHCLCYQAHTGWRKNCWTGRRSQVWMWILSPTRTVIVLFFVTLMFVLQILEMCFFCCIPWFWMVLTFYSKDTSVILYCRVSTQRNEVFQNFSKLW